VVTIDVHNLAAFQNAFRCATEHLEAGPLFAAHLAPLLKDREAVVVSPDAGGIKRADQFRQQLARLLGKPAGTAFVEKYRSGGVVSGGMLVGDVDGKVAVIIDDLVSSGATLARAAHACIEHGAAGAIAAATHGLFMGDAPQLLAGGALQRIVVTDTVPPFRLGQGAAMAKLDIVSCTAMFATAIRCIHTGESMSESMAS
jgi:ribose-phosphate pyrophosphokinase